LILREDLSQSLRNVGLELGHARLEALWSYVELLIKWNRRINLTGFSFDGNAEAALERLLLEPLAAARLAKSAQRVLDVGSGGGSPAIPFFLGLVQTSELVLVESRTKKAVFLREALRATGIPGKVVADRFEQLVVPEPFDAMTVRASATVAFSATNPLASSSALYSGSATRSRTASFSTSSSVCRCLSANAVRVES